MSRQWKKLCFQIVNLFLNNEWHNDTMMFTYHMNPLYNIYTYNFNCIVCISCVVYISLWGRQSREYNVHDMYSYFTIPLTITWLYWSSWCRLWTNICVWWRWFCEVKGNLLMEGCQTTLSCIHAIHVLYKCLVELFLLICFCDILIKK
jgi:hypothetical protein